jgi:hypothetical protein
MLGKYYYHQIIRKTIVAFGSLFNNIYIYHKDENGSTASEIKVPISYGPIQKFLARIEQKPDLRKRVAITLPRMSFEMNSIRYDGSRKVSTMQTFNTTNISNGNAIQVYMPVPYTIGFELNIITKLNDDMLQIIEQILPYFQPHFNLTVDLVDSIGEKRDIPIIIEGIQMSDNYEGNYEERRNLIYTINFTAKTYLFGPIADSTEGLIKKVQVDYYTSTDKVNSRRELRYTSTPRAIKDYNNDESSFLSQDIDELITQFEVSSTISLEENSYIAIGDEEMFIEKISGNTITVKRGQDGSKIYSHNIGDPINLVNNADSELINYGDDFGFEENLFDFSDGKVYSPTKGIDVEL